LKKVNYIKKNYVKEHVKRYCHPNSGNLKKKNKIEKEKEERKKTYHPISTTYYVKAST
jgi:hypothetical protein